MGYVPGMAPQIQGHQKCSKAGQDGKNIFQEVCRFGEIIRNCRAARNGRAKLRSRAEV